MKTFIRHNPKEIKEDCRAIVVYRTPSNEINWTVGLYNKKYNNWITTDSRNYTGCTVTDVYLYEEEPNFTVPSGDDPFAEVFSPIEWN